MAPNAPGGVKLVPKMLKGVKLIFSCLVLLERQNRVDGIQRNTAEKREVPKTLRFDLTTKRLHVYGSRAQSAWKFDALDALSYRSWHRHRVCSCWINVSANNFPTISGSPVRYSWCKLSHSSHNSSHQLASAIITSEETDLQRWTRMIPRTCARRSRWWMNSRRKSPHPLRDSKPANGSRGRRIRPRIPTRWNARPKMKWRICREMRMRCTRSRRPSDDTRGVITLRMLLTTSRPQCAGRRRYPRFASQVTMQSTPPARDSASSWRSIVVRSLVPAKRNTNPRWRASRGYRRSNSASNSSICWPPAASAARWPPDRWRAYGHQKTSWARTTATARTQSRWSHCPRPRRRTLAPPKPTTGVSWPRPRVMFAESWRSNREAARTSIGRRAWTPRFGVACSPTPA